MSHLDIDIIFLDAGRTLLLTKPGVGEVYAKAARPHGIVAPAPVVEEAFRLAFEEKRGSGLPQDREWWRDVVRRTFLRLGDVADLDGLFDELYEHFSGPGAWRAYPEARAVVEELRARGYRTGVISNWDDRLPALLDGMGFQPGLDPVVVSGLVGAEKPDPRIYAVALERAGVEAGRALMVGDDREADFDGARAAGLQAVHLDRSGAEDGIASLTELLDLLPGRGA